MSTTITKFGKGDDQLPDAENSLERGVIPNAIRHIFGAIDAAETGKKFLVRCSYLEIYNE